MVDRTKIRNWLSKKASGMVCPICKTDSFIILNKLIVPSIVEDDQSVTNVKAGSFVGLICNNCAHCLFFSARVMGLSYV